MLPLPLGEGQGEGASHSAVHFPHPNPFQKEDGTAQNVARLTWLLVLSLAIWSAQVRADDLAQLKAALEQPLLAPAQPLKEMRAFIEPRIIKMPQVTDRAQWEFCICPIGSKA
ncbi:MAG: hypothetical protein HY288_06235 [Planctomycetia bacterium]|nr:hypothetical protein [Planctomycetia bacterium]